ncbi:MAG: hypothetical protein JEZ06_24745 [Anaerolineaceae bacterium]|nr:hypothetical protein [Anaerolineaceae bacterium]
MYKAKNPTNSGLRLIISPVRSGSTALLHCFVNNRFVDQTFYQPVKTGLRLEGKGDYKLFYRNDGRVVVAKETMGPYFPNECNLDIFPNGDKEQAIIVTRPVFLFRDPLAIYTSAKMRGWCDRSRPNNGFDVDKLSLVYRAVWNMYLYAVLAFERAQDCLGPLCVTYNQIAENPEKILKTVCRYWGIEFDYRMLKWEIPFTEAVGNPENTEASRKIVGGQDFFALIETGAFDGISASTGFLPINRDGEQYITISDASRIIDLGLCDIFKQIEEKTRAVIKKFDAIESFA